MLWPCESLGRLRQEASQGTPMRSVSIPHRPCSEHPKNLHSSIERFGYRAVRRNAASASVSSKGPVSDRLRVASRSRLAVSPVRSLINDGRSLPDAPRSMRLREWSIGRSHRCCCRPSSDRFFETDVYRKVRAIFQRPRSSARASRGHGS